MKNKKVCKHDLMYIERFTRQKQTGSSSQVEPIIDVYRFICRKPNCLMFVDITKNDNN
ncbi:hypothetical protein M0R04_10435 [Candidatus Dojkabacteria bacterium]|nr:hypothetical protein [Candidatus Dojkabacteria bacterium]